GRVELQDGGKGGSGTRVRAAALGDPDAAPVLVDLDRARRSPRAARGQLEVLLDRLVGIGKSVRRLHVALCEQGGAEEHDQNLRAHSVGHLSTTTFFSV